MGEADVFDNLSHVQHNVELFTAAFSSASAVGVAIVRSRAPIAAAWNLGHRNVARKRGQSAPTNGRTQSAIGSEQQPAAAARYHRMRSRETLGGAFQIRGRTLRRF